MILEIELSDAQLAKIANIVVSQIEREKKAPAQSAKGTYTVFEAAALLRVANHTIRNHIKAGIIPTVQGIGKVIRIPAAYVDGLLNVGGHEG